MQSRSLYSYIYLGTALFYLQSVDEGTPINKYGYIKDNIKAFLSGIEEMGLPVTRRSAKELAQILEKLPQDDEAKLSADDYEALHERMKKVRAVIDAESGGVFAYIVNEKRFETRKLVENIWELFDNTVQERVSDITIYDLSEAGKCIAFERSTAAAFHLMRAVEETLKKLYCHLVKRNRSSLMWGPMVQSLRTKRSPPSAVLLDHIDNIRKNFRNPTQHPEKVYDISEVQDLLGVCIDVLNRMSHLLPPRAP